MAKTDEAGQAVQSQVSMSQAELLAANTNVARLQRKVATEQAERHETMAVARCQIVFDATLLYMVAC